MKNTKNNTIPHVITMVMMSILMGLFISGMVSAVQDYYLNTHANFVQEYATIVRYEKMPNRYHPGYTYSTFYEYEADGGVYYGLWQRLIENEEDAKAQVGKKVRIYVDHTLKHHTTTLNFSTSPIWLSRVFAFFSSLLFFNSAVRETIYIVKWVKYKKSKDKKLSE